MSASRRRRAAWWLLVALSFGARAALAAASPCPPGPAEPYAHVVGQRVTDVQLKVPRPHKLSELRPLIDVRVGEPLDPSEVQAALVRLFALGHFAQVEVFDLPQRNAQGQLTGVGLLFVLTPKSRLRTLHLRGRLGVEPARLRQALRLVREDEVDAGTAAMLHRHALAFLRQSGYPAARLQVRSQAMQLSGHVDFILEVDAGRAQRLAHLDFTGNPRLPATVLADICHSRVGDPVDLQRLQADREQLRKTFIAHDFLQAQVAPPILRPRADGDVDVALRLDAGPRIDFAYLNNHALSDAFVRALLPQDNVLALPAQLRLWRQAILTAYQRRGYLSAHVQLHQVPGRQPAQHTTVVVQVDEGTPLRIARIQFTGNTALPSYLLEHQCRALLQRELGDDPAFEPLRPFDQRRRSGRASSSRVAPSPTHIAAKERYVPELYADAGAQIAAAYRDLGFLQVRVSPPTCRLIPQAADAQAGIDTAQLTLDIDEGRATHVRDLVFAGNHALAASDLFALVQTTTEQRPFSAPLRPGLPLSQGGLEEARIALLRHYRNQGFLYASVEAEMALQQPTSAPRADVLFRIDEGPQVRIARTLLRGNVFTRDGIVRSRLSLQPGDLYRLEQAIDDQRSLAKLGVFSSVRVRLLEEDQPTPQKDLLAELSERRRQAIEVAPGISTSDGPRLRASYAHLNTFGTATAFTASLKVNRQIFFPLFGDYADALTKRYANYRGIEQLTRAVEREARLGLRAPPLRLLPLDPILRLDLVDLRVNAVRYSLDSQTLVLGADMRMVQRLKGSLEAQLGLVNLECDPRIDPACNLTPEIRHLEGRPIDVGNLYIASAGPHLIYDGRDSPLNAHRGIYGSLRFAVARGGASPFSSGLLQPFAFIKYDGNLTGYLPLGEATLAMSLRAGLISRWRSQVPIDQRFFMGGRDSLRGFVEATLIPQDACAGSGPVPAGCAEQLAPGPPPLSRGGNSYALLKTELRLPISTSLAFTIFIDAGNLWIDVFSAGALRLRLGTGVGLRYATPVGAMALDLGWNPAPRRAFGEPSLQGHFSLGTF